MPKVDLGRDFVSDYLSSDHRRLDVLFEGLLVSIRNEKPIESQLSMFHLFKNGLLKHIYWEESYLFPLFEQHTGMTQGPTMVMMAEHKEMQALLETIELAAIEVIDEEMLLTLADMLEAHNTKEEQILYPAIDRLLDDDMLQKIVINMSQHA